MADLLADWPWPCHRVGHVFEDDIHCTQCGARHRWDDVADIVATGRRRFADKRREELPNYFTLPSGLLLDLS
jgi:hypothetical protein